MEFSESADLRPPMPLKYWLESTREPTPAELAEALAKAMAASGKDYWKIGEDVMPPNLPHEVLEWLEQPPAWPAYRPAREAWLSACVFALAPDGSGWSQGGVRIEEAWARECVSRFLQMVGQIHPGATKSSKLVDDTYKELQRMAWPYGRLAASEDPLAGWVRGVLEVSPSSYVATVEIFSIWKTQNPDDPVMLREFGERLARIILVWQKAASESGLVGPIKNISRSCCREYPRNKRPRGWAGLTIKEGFILASKFR